MLPKKADPQSPRDLRPISVGNYFYSVYSKTLATFDFCTTFAGQFGDVKNGVEGLAHAARMAESEGIVDGHQTYVSLSLDARQAYDSVYHAAIHDSLFANETAAKTRRAILWSVLSDPRISVLCDKGKPSSLLTVERGVPQGCAASTKLFHMVIDEPLRNADAVNGCHLLALHDDMLLIGRPEDIKDKLATLKSELSLIGLEFNLNKCKIAINRDGPLHASLLDDVNEHLGNFAVTEEPIRHCGTQIGGTIAQRQSIYGKQIEAVIANMNRLCESEVMTTQQQALVLRFCHGTRIEHLTRYLPFTELRDTTIEVNGAPVSALEHFDQQIAKAFISDTLYESITPHRRDAMTLPSSMGGVGFMCMEERQAISYICSNLATRKLTKHGQLSPDHPLLEELSTALTACADRVESDFNNANFLTLLNDRSNQHDDLAHRLSHVPSMMHLTNSNKKERIVQHYGDNEMQQKRVRVMLAQWSTLGAAMWFVLPLILPRMTMPDNAFRYAMTTRLFIRPDGLPLDGTNCEVCGQTVHSFDMHYLNCSMAKNRDVPRDPIKHGHNIAYGHLQRNAVNASSEVKHVKLQPSGLPVVPHCIVQPDLEVDGTNGERLVTDFTIANVLCKTAMEGGQDSKMDFYEDVRAQAKEAKYKVTIEHEQAKFIPFVVTALGKWHKSATAFYKQMATFNPMRKGLTRILMAVTIQQRNMYSLIQYRSARMDALSGLNLMAQMPDAIAAMGEQGD